MTELDWLPEIDDFRTRLRALRGAPETAWSRAVALADSRLDFIRTNALDETLRGVIGEAPPRQLASQPIRLAILGSCTLAHLHGAIRVAGLRRGLHITIYENDFGQYWQELADGRSPLHAFDPDVVLLALDAHHLAAGLSSGMDDENASAASTEAENRIRRCWRLAREAFGCHVIHQTPLPTHATILGNNEHRLPGSPASFIARLNARLREAADAEGVDLLAIDDRAARDGIDAWHNVAFWHRAKQEVSSAAAPMYGDLLARLIAAKRGMSRKCLVLDLDNTLWGGVVGDDGVEGLVLGEGSASGEAFVAFQRYARELSRRGVILAVCSKNEEAAAFEPFDRHPEMVLRRGDIACFMANWSDKAANIRRIAEELNIGLDSLVFVDDNPFERSLVREALPMVAVPEVGDDPTLFPGVLANAGYFESLAVTAEDRARGAQYLKNRERVASRGSTTDLSSYLRGLEMELHYRPFDRMGLQRIVQLINKTNQFNLTTRRYAEEDVLKMMGDERSFGLQLRLLDRFGDNGMIAVVIGRMQNDEECLIDTWLMSCRVLGRQVEQATLNIVAAQARNLGALRLVGAYVPTAKNAMVRDHYARLGFTVTHVDEAGGSSNVLDLSRFVQTETFIRSAEG